MCGFSVQIWLLFLAEPNFIHPYTHSLTAASASTSQRICPPHTHRYKHTHKVLWIPGTHMLLQASKTLTQTQSSAFKRNKSCRAGWSPFCFLSKSFIFAPQQEPRHHNSHSRYSVAVPTVKKTERPCAFVWYVYLSGPLRGQAAVLCGLRESFVTGKTAV